MLKQGEIYSAGHLKDRFQYLISGDDDLFLVLTPYTCAILKAKNNEISTTKAILATRKKPDPKFGNFKRAKNPYRLYLDFPGEQDLLELNIDMEIQIDVEAVEKGALINRLPLDDINLMTRWLANYYRAPALPNNFNQRFNSTLEILKKKLSKFHGVIDRVYLRLETEEDFDKDTPYIADILIAVKSEFFDAQRESLINLANDVSKTKDSDLNRNWVQKTEFGDLNLELTIESDSFITMQDLRSNLVEITWLDYISYKAGSDQSDL